MTVEARPSLFDGDLAAAGDPWPSRLLSQIRETRPLIARAFGTNGHDTSMAGRDFDLIVVLRPAPSFGAALAAVARTVQLLSHASFAGPVSPAFNLQTWFGPTGEAPALHLVLYADPSLLLRLESPAFLDNVLTPHELEAVHRAPQPAESVTRHFDLLDKATHALVLLLNTEPRLRACAEEHAARVARYVSRWSPSRPATRRSSSRQALAEAVEFYSSFDCARPVDVPRQ